MPPSERDPGRDRETIADSAIADDPRAVAGAATLPADDDGRGGSGRGATRPGSGLDTTGPGAGGTGAGGDAAIDETAESGELDDPVATLPPGTVIDHFVVENQLGAGGMGVVVAARDKLLDRKVAIKVLRRRFGGAAADSAHVRLLREAQAMAKLAHPNVVTVFEVGTHDGQIFVAMELIDGATLADWLREAPRTTTEIVEQFARAGRGLAAAHRLGMVHRDFKPENVLVGRDGAVRVTDFGLVGMARGSASGDAGDAGDAGTDDTLDAAVAPRAAARASDDRPIGRGSPLDQPLTRTGALLGTPLYMAPEQHLHRPVTAKVDQFAFCVALHEALYGAPPFRGATVRELRDSVLAGTPAPPPSPAPRDVPPWLRAIVLRGLALAPADRWPDMDELLAALTRDRSAGRRRARLAAGALGVAGTAVALFAVARRADEPPPCPPADARLTGVWDPAVRKSIETAFAATGRPYAADTLGRAATALDGYTRGWLAMRTEACEATAVRHEQSPALLDRRMQCLDRRLIELGALTQLFRAGGDPVVVDRAVQATLGLAPLASCADADGLLAQVPLPTDPAARTEVAALRGELARSTALTRAGKPKDALAAVTPVVARARAVNYPPVLAEVLLQQGTMQRDVADPKLAEATVIEAARVAGEAKNDALVAKAMIEQMWIVGYRGGRHAEALALVPYIEAAVARAGNDPLMLGNMFRYQAILLDAQGKLTEAQAAAERALALCERGNPDGREVASALTTLANIQSARDQRDAARAAYERCRAIFARLYGPDHPDVAAAQSNLANMLLRQGKLAEAVEAYRATLAITERVNGPEGQRTGAVLYNLGMALGLQERWDAAHDVTVRALAIYEKNLGPEHPDLVDPLYNLGDEMVAHGRLADAEPFYARAIAVREKAFGPDSVRTAYALEPMARLRVLQRRFTDALALARRVEAIRSKELAAGSPQIAAAQIIVGEAEAGTGRTADGLATAERGVATLAAQGDKTAPAEIGDAWFALARVARLAGRPVRAREAADRARDAYDRIEPGAQRDRKQRELAAWGTPPRR